MDRNDGHSRVRGILKLNSTTTTVILIICDIRLGRSLWIYGFWFIYAFIFINGWLEFVGNY